MELAKIREDQKQQYYNDQYLENMEKQMKMEDKFNEMKRVESEIQMRLR